MTAQLRKTGVLLAIFASGMLVTACGSSEEERVRSIAPSKTTALGINGFLWRAALDNISFMPLVEVDSSSGVIVTDWYINPEVPNERLKVTVFVLDKDLRADAVKVSVLRQERLDGAWVNGVVRAGTALRIEEAILRRARELRISTIED